MLEYFNISLTPFFCDTDELKDIKCLMRFVLKWFSVRSSSTADYFVIELCLSRDRCSRETPYSILFSSVLLLHGSANNAPAITLVRMRHLSCPQPWLIHPCISYLWYRQLFVHYHGDSSNTIPIILSSNDKINAAKNSKIYSRLQIGMEKRFVMADLISRHVVSIWFQSIKILKDVRTFKINGTF